MSQYVVIDLEMCKVPHGRRTAAFPWSLELIEIGAVLMNECFEITDEFKTYVSPEFGFVDHFIRDLTGICQKDTQNAPCAQDALSAFTEWLPEDAVIVSWSMTDRSQFKKELSGKAIDLPALLPYFETWTDCQKMFGDAMESRRQYRLSEALVFASIDYSDGAHDALIDAKNTAMLFKQLKTDTFSPNPYMTDADEKPCTYSAFAELSTLFSMVG
ncbi:MAG: exonuclease domain-containing protein [Clostridia bacterium]|nr:exonuclease domain-containing protein [Clostridia bacterium]